MKPVYTLGSSVRLGVFGCVWLCVGVGVCVIQWLIETLDSKNMHNQKKIKKEKTQKKTQKQFKIETTTAQPNDKQKWKK